MRLVNVPLTFAASNRYVSKQERGAVNIRELHYRGSPYMMTFGQDLSLPQQPVLPRMLCRLPETKAYLLFILNALLERTGKLNGPSLHSHLAALLQSAVDDEMGLQEWLRGRFIARPMRLSKAFETARKQANQWLEKGTWVASWEGAFPPAVGLSECPRILLGQGALPADQTWAAFFNSRKGKLVSPRAEWLKALRTMLSVIASHEVGFAASLGTTTYDLVTVGAGLLGAKLLLLLPHAIEEVDAAKASSPIGLSHSPDVTLTCLTRAADCPKPTRMVCRDRLLAFIADVHCLLELRAGGNLNKLLEKQQQMHPRTQWSLLRERGSVKQVPEPHMLQVTLRKTPDLLKQTSGGTKPLPSKRATARNPFRMLDGQAIQWHAYLYHYTRSCPGPWPGESYRDFLMNLLDNGPFGEHTALAALLHILAEGRIRAGSRIVRGNHRVVSWTSRPPRELSAIRRWNPALIRWTFEPYGLAVKRGLLRKRGAKPAIYAVSTFYEKLGERERFRFQLHDPSRCRWKSEREWRLPDDLPIRELEPEQAFVFAPTLSEAEACLRHAACFLPVVALE